MTLALLITIPLFLVWLIVLVDVTVRRDLSPWGRAGWIAGVTLIWPTMILYLLLRPVQGRLTKETAVRRRNPDPRHQLVEAVLEHRAGRLGPSEYDEVLRELRRAGGGGGGDGRDGRARNGRDGRDGRARKEP